MNIKPLFDRVLILPSEEKHNSNSNIILPETAKEKSQFGKVVAVGDGENFDYVKGKMKVQIGDTVLFNKYAGVEIKLDEKTYIVMRQVDLIGVVENV